MLFLPQLTPAKKKQLIYLLLISFGLVIVIWIFWVTKFGYSRQAQVDNTFFNNILKRSQVTVDQYDNFKNQLQTTWQQVESAVNQSQQQADIIDEMKVRLTATTTASTTTSTATSVELINEQGE